MERVLFRECVGKTNILQCRDTCGAAMHNLFLQLIITLRVHNHDGNKVLRHQRDLKVRSEDVYVLKPAVLPPLLLCSKT